MKKSSDDERRERSRQPASPVPVKPASGKGRLALILLVCLLGSVSVSYVAFKFFLFNNLPPELVGTWQVNEGPLRGATLEFCRDGTVIATLTVKGKKVVTNQSAKVEGKKLILTSYDPDTRKDDKVIQTIISLTDDELILRDEDQRTYRMKRTPR